MKKVQFRVLYREFLFRIVDLEMLSVHAEGDSRRLLGQIVSLLVFSSLMLAMWAGLWAGSNAADRVPPLTRMMNAWSAEHFLIATTMLVVGLFALLSWESTFPDRRDIMVLGPLPVDGRTLFLAKAAAVASALGLILASLHVLAGFAWPLALAQPGSAITPAMVFDAPLPPVGAADFPAVMNRDIAPMLRELGRAAADGGGGIVIGISEHGVRRVMTYGAAKADSLFEIGSISKTFTGLLLAQMSVEGKLDLRDHVRELLPPGTVAAPASFEINLLDLATHHSGLPRMPDNPGPGDEREKFSNYRTADLYAFLQRHGVAKTTTTQFLYSNLGFAVLGAALANRARSSYAELVRREITEPLGLKDTAISLSPEQAGRFIEGHGYSGQATPAWDLDAFASAGGIRSTAGDLLTYLEAQLRPEKTPLRAALVRSQQFRKYTAGRVRIALAWVYDPDTRVYAHDGATGGFTSYACFDPQRDFAAVVLVNAHPITFPIVGVLGEHVRQRLSGEPALSLTPVSVPGAGLIRSFFAYWITMVAAGLFVYCCVLGLQGMAGQLLPRQWFLRTSAWLQIAVFGLLVSAYFLQRSPASVLVAGPRQPWLSWVPSYWFIGLFQQLSGSLHPSLGPLAWRAWIGLGVAVLSTATAYAASYLRTLRKILEEPDIVPGLRGGWQPRFGGSFETAIVQFSMRSLLRSRQHRMIFAFYLGIGFAFTLLFLNVPSGEPASAADIWHAPSVPLLASTIMLMGFWVVGARVVIGLPLDLPANWTFRGMPFGAGRQCLKARRYVLLVLAVGPVWALEAALLLWLWPWKQAAAHLAALAMLGVILAEFSIDGVQRIPFTCSYLPGRSNVHLTFWLWIVLLLVVVTGAAVNERDALEKAGVMGTVLAGLGVAAAVSVVRNNWLAKNGFAELRFEEIPADRLVRLELSGGGAP